MRNTSAVPPAGQTLVPASTRLAVGPPASTVFLGKPENAPISVPDFLAEMESYNFEGNFPNDGANYRGTDAN